MKDIFLVNKCSLCWKQFSENEIYTIKDNKKFCDDCLRKKIVKVDC